MTKPKIFILSGPVQSGKTSRLLKWCEGRNDVSGILTPDVQGKRYFMDIGTRELFSMEAAKDENDILIVGKYQFSKAAFDRANKILFHCKNKNTGWMIIDEAGPLELKGEGFSDLIKQIISGPPGLNIILVVRENLLNAVLQYFNIQTFSLFTGL